MVNAAKDFYPNLHVIHLDAHADLRTTYEGTHFSHACVMSTVVRQIGAGNVSHFGIRSGTSSEWAKLKENKNLFQLDVKTMSNLISELVDVPTYLTLDLDLLNPSELCGTGCPEPGGISSTELNEIFTCWEDYIQNSYYDISCRALDANNLILNDIFQVANIISANQINPYVFASPNGDYLITWQDSRNFSGNVAPNDDIYIQQITNGNIIFEENGLSVCNANFSQSYPQIELYDESDNSYIIFWNDLRSSGKADLVNIYAQSITLSVCTTGDLNIDGIVNVIDIVALVSIVLNPNSPSTSELCLADFNLDAVINVIDIVALVNLILSN